MVMFAPGGLASLIMMNLQMARWRKLGRLLPAYAALLGAGSVMLLVAFALIEMVYHRQLGGSDGSTLLFLSLPLDTSSARAWLGVLGLLVAAALVFRPLLRRFLVQWEAAQHEIEQALQSRGGSP